MSTTRTSSASCSPTEAEPANQRAILRGPLAHRDGPPPGSGLFNPAKLNALLEGGQVLRGSAGFRAALLHE